VFRSRANKLFINIDEAVIANEQLCWKRLSSVIDVSGILYPLKCRANLVESLVPLDDDFGGLTSVMFRSELDMAIRRFDPEERSLVCRYQPSILANGDETLYNGDCDVMFAKLSPFRDLAHE
jgi:hypothetical protein